MESLGQCLKYKKGLLILKMALPEKRPVCQYCAYGLHKDGPYDRYTCRFTGELIFDPRNSIGDFCPVNWEEENG